MRRAVPVRCSMARQACPVVCQGQVPEVLEDSDGRDLSTRARLNSQTTVIGWVGEFAEV